MIGRAGHEKDGEFEESGGKAAARLREQLERELGEIPTESPSEPGKQSDDKQEDKR